MATGQEGTGEFTCRASALRVTSPLLMSEPIVANRLDAATQCRDDFAQLANVTLGSVARADLANAQTNNEPTFAQSNASTTTATVNLGGTVVTAGVLESQARVTCRGAHPDFSGSSNIVNLVINGNPITVTGQPNQTINASPLVVVVINEQVQEPDRLTVRALRVSSPLLATHVIVSESVVDVHRCRDNHIHDHELVMPHVDDLL